MGCKALRVNQVALLIDAKNEAMAHWYVGYGAFPLLDNRLLKSSPSPLA